jgi:hypothetical protein
MEVAYLKLEVKNSQVIVFSSGKEGHSEEGERDIMSGLKIRPIMRYFTAEISYEIFPSS